MPNTVAPTDPVPDTTSSRRSVGATWVAATGASLVLVAAAVLVASRWDRISDIAKLAMLVTGTGLCAYAGRRLRPSLPATGNVVFHLGVLLVPANVAAVLVHLGASLGVHLLTQGVTCTAAFAAGSALAESKMLRWAALLSVPVATFGVGALTPVPALVVLVACAIAADRVPALRADDAVVPWALGVGFAPAAIAWLVVEGPDASGPLHALQIERGSLGATAWLTGLVAAVILGYRARRDEDLNLANLAIAAGLVGAVTTAATSSISTWGAFLGLAGAFVLIETLAIAAQADRFWRKPAAGFATAAEVGAIGAFGLLVLIALGARSFDISVPSIAASCFTFAIGWFLADMRRAEPSDAGAGRYLATGSGSVIANVAMAACVTTGVAATSLPLYVTALTVAALAVVITATRRPGAPLVAGAGPVAILLAAGHPVAIAASAAVIVAAGVVQSRRAIRPWNMPNAVTQLAAALATVGFGAIGLELPATISLLVVIATYAGIAASFDTESWVLATTSRVALAAPFFVALALEPGQLIVPTAAVTAVLAFDGVRLRKSEFLTAGVVASNAPMIAGALLAGLSFPVVGVALGFAAIVWAGMGLLLGTDRSDSLYIGAVVTSALSLVLAAGDPQAFVAALAIVGGLVLAAGVINGEDGVSHLGALAMSAAAIGHLGLHHVSVPELYVLPTTLHLVVAGEIARRRGPVSSWLSVAPAPSLLAGAALLERVAGGNAWHALLCAAVAGLAVIVGGQRREAGPLFAGTILLAALGGKESFAALAGIPAWGWIGLVGATLIAAAVWIERADLSPAQVGRRLVDVISEQYS